LVEYGEQQVEVEANGVIDAIDEARVSGLRVEPEEIDPAAEPSYGAAFGNERRWLRVTFNVLPGGYPDENEDSDE
jgi:hypothetical protein